LTTKFTQLTAALRPLRAKSFVTLVSAHRPLWLLRTMEPQQSLRHS